MENTPTSTQNETKKRGKKTRMITPPMLLGAAVVVGIRKYRQTKKWNQYIEQVKENTNHVKRVTILGDSVAKGYGSPNGGITNYLKEHFDNKYGKVIVKNEGILHLTSEGLLQKVVNEKAYDDYLRESNFIFINIGGNDLLKYYHQGGPGAVIRNFLKARSDYLNNIEQIIQYIEAINPAITIVMNNLYNSLEENYQFFGLTSVFIQYWNAGLNKLPVIQINTRELNRKDDLWADMVHPNQAGYEHLSHLIINQVSKLLEDGKENKPPMTLKN